MKIINLAWKNIFKCFDLLHFCRARWFYVSILLGLFWLVYNAFVKTRFISYCYYLFNVYVSQQIWAVGLLVGYGGHLWRIEQNIGHVTDQIRPINKIWPPVKKIWVDPLICRNINIKVRAKLCTYVLYSTVYCILISLLSLI